MEGGLPAGERGGGRKSKRNKTRGGGGSGGLMSGLGADSAAPDHQAITKRDNRPSTAPNATGAGEEPASEGTQAAPGTHSCFNAAAEAFLPSSLNQIEGSTSSTGYHTTYATTNILQASERLGTEFGPPNSIESGSQVSVPGDLSASRPDHPAKSPRSSVKYIAELKRLEDAKADKKTSKSSSEPVEPPSAIRDAFLAAPPAKSFLEFIDQTQAIIDANSLTVHGAGAKELSAIGSGSEPKPNRESFNVHWALNRTRSPAFPELIQAQSSTSAHASASTPCQSVLPPKIEVSVPTPGRLPFPTPTQSALPPTAEPSAPIARRVTFSTPTEATSTGPVQASYTTPTKGSLPYLNLPSNSTPRRPFHMHSQSFSQPAASLFSVSQPGPSSYSATRPSNRGQFVTPTKSSLKASQPLTQGSPLDRPNDTDEQKKKISSVMFAFREFGDSFDSMEWPQTEGQASYSESPEPLTVPPQPVASYTTVGSLKPAAHQQFTAPNRIQRDGTGRRAPQANGQTRGHDSHFGGRGLTHQYNPGYGSSAQPHFGASNRSQYGSMNQPQFGSSTQPHFGSMNQPQHDSTSQCRYSSPAQPQYGAQPQCGVPNQSQYGAPTHSQYGSVHQRRYGPLAQSGSLNQAHYESPAQSQFGSIHNLQNPDGSGMSLTDAEKNVLQANGLSEPLFGCSAPSMRSGNIPHQHRDMESRIDPSLNPQAESFNLQGQLKDNGSGQTTFTQNSLPKIGKMQTLLNLSHYKNPVQQIAKDHLAEFAAPNTQYVAMSTGAPVAQQSAMPDITSYGQTIIGDNDQGSIGYEKQEKGDFDHNYRFPPPGLVHPMQANRSGAGYGHQTLSGFDSYEQFNTSQQQQIRSGRPQPLAAGPPGQRQNAGFAISGMSSAQGIQAGSSQLSNAQHPPALPPNSPWLPHNRNNMFTSVPTEHSKIRDTLPLDEIRQYYPNGFPSDMTGQYTRLPGVIGDGRPGMSEEEIKLKKTNEWFHAGVRNFNKTANDHLAELERRNNELNNGLDPQPPGTLDEYGNPLTLKELVAMSEPDVAAPLLHGLFGNILKYADQVPGPNNQSMMSKFAPTAPWCIDNSEQGNRSFFGEDWGPTPKRLGRDPRYQPFE